MKLFAKRQTDFATRDDFDRLYDRVRGLETSLYKLQRDTMYFESESSDEEGFRLFDQRPRISLKSVVMALAEHLGMRIEVEPAKPPGAKLTRKLD